MGVGQESVTSTQTAKDAHQTTGLTVYNMRIGTNPMTDPNLNSYIYILHIYVFCLNTYMIILEILAHKSNL